MNFFNNKLGKKLLHNFFNNKLLKKLLHTFFVLFSNILLSKIKTFLGNLGPKIGNLLPKIKTFLGNLLPKIETFFLIQLPKIGNLLPKIKTFLGNLGPKIKTFLGNLGPKIKTFLGISYCVLYGIFCLYCLYHCILWYFFENIAYNISLFEEVKPSKKTRAKMKQQKVRFLFQEPVKPKPKKQNNMKDLSILFSGASFIFEYYVALINCNFKVLTYKPDLSVAAKKMFSKSEVKSEVVRYKSEPTTSEVLELYTKPITRGKDRRARGDRMAKAMEAAIREGIINYKVYCVPFTNILDLTNIFAFDKWLYGHYYSLVHLDRFLKPKSAENFSDFVLICQFMEEYNFKYNLTRAELDYLLTFKTHYKIHSVKWNYVEWLLCLESYKNNLELLEQHGVLEKIRAVKDLETFNTVKDIIKIENIKNIDNIDNIINVKNKANIARLNVKRRIPLLLMFDLDLRLAYLKYSENMVDSYYGMFKVFRYPDETFERFLRVKKRFDDRVLLVNIIEGFSLLEHYRDRLTPSKLGECWMFSLQNYDGLLHEYIHVIVNPQLQKLPISIIHNHFKYDPKFRYVYKNLVKNQRIQYLNLWLIDALHTFFYSNGSCQEFLKALLLESKYPNALVTLNAIKNVAPSYFTFADIVGVGDLHMRYNQVGEMRGGYYFTGRKYSVEQLIKFYQTLGLQGRDAPDSRPIDEEDELRKLHRTGLFSTFYNVDDMTFHKKAQKRGLK